MGTISNELIAKKARTEQNLEDHQTSRANAAKSLKGKLGHDIAKLATTIDLVVSKSTTLENEVKEPHRDLAALTKLQAEMDKMRQESHVNCVQTKADWEIGRLDGES